MPPKRRAAASTQTLHSFSTVGKHVSKTGKPTGKTSTTAEPKKQEQPKPKIKLVVEQDGDEDVIVKRVEPTEAKVEAPAKTEAKVEVESVKAKPPPPPPPTKGTPAKTRAAKKATASPAAKTPGGKRKRTLLDDFVSSPAKKREIKPLRSARLPTPPTSDTVPLEAEAGPLLDDPFSSDPAPLQAELPVAPEELPVDLTHLQSLHASLLTALLLHRAHHSNSIQPPVFAVIKQHVERLCRRNISLEDVRKIVYLSHYSSSDDDPTTTESGHWEKEGGLKLVDYGNGKICIDFAEKTKERKLVNSEVLKRDFLARTDAWWDYTKKPTNPTTTTGLPTPPSSFADATNPPVPSDSEDPSPPPPPTPLSLIPLAKLHAHPKATTIAKVLHTKGQQRLDDLLKRHKPSAPTAPPKSTKGAPPAARGTSLLDRIRAKAAVAAEAASAAPTKEELLRTAAEQRVGDIEPILKGLAGRGVNMTMKACVDGIRESVRNPVSREQAEMAVRIVAERQGWVKVREVGKVVGVVFGRRAEEGEFV